MVDLYLFLLQCDDEKIDVETVVTPSDDNRSYHVSSEKMRNQLGFTATRSVTDAARDFAQAFSDGKIKDPMIDPQYFNIKLMQQVKLK